MRACVRACVRACTSHCVWLWSAQELIKRGMILFMSDIWRVCKKRQAGPRPSDDAPWMKNYAPFTDLYTTPLRPYVDWETKTQCALLFTATVSKCIRLHKRTGGFRYNADWKRIQLHIGSEWVYALHASASSILSGLVFSCSLSQYIRCVALFTNALV